MAKVNIADRKRIKRARAKERRELAYKAATEYEELQRSAHGVHERLHQLPEGSFSPACLTACSAGVLGWAKYMEATKPMMEKAP